MDALTPCCNSWVDATGDDFWLIHDEGTRLPSPPLAFGPPRFVYLHKGRVLEIVPVHWAGDSCWKITDRGPAPGKITVTMEA